MKKVVKEFLKKALIIILAVFMITVFFSLLDEKPTFADSGFSTSHSSGGSHHSSSRSSSRSSRSSSSSGSSSTPGSIIGLLIFIIIFIVILNLSTKKSTQPMSKAKINDKEIEDEIKKLIPNFDKYVFLKEGFNIYCDVQEAWMNFKLEDVKDILTDELYSMYESQLATLEVKGEQNIMKDITLRSSYLRGVVKQNDNITIEAGYVIEMYDYIADQQSGKLLRGESNRKMRVTYSMKFRKTLDESAKVEHCPNCGAKIKMNSSGTCEYCGSKIVADNTKWVLTEKKALDQYYI
ncbi:MAG: TIM44-like domain-containing protein [Clostridia bacterium]|nr:TIM44-like domain-containing protein [Clostridia bacterium]